MYGSLPKREKTFTIDLVGKETGIKYKGNFTAYSALTISQKHSMELEKTRLLADFPNPSKELMGIAILLSSIRAKLIKYPEWWTELGDGSEIIDENIILSIYDKIEDIGKEWKDSITQEASKANKAQKEEATEGK